MNRIVVRASKTLFNQGYYLRQVREDLTSYKRSALDHFCLRGWRKGYNPHPLFDINYYLKNNPDVKKERWNPWLHFFIHGKRERRNPHLLFDINYYKSQSKRSLGRQDPLSHFIKKGWMQGKSPSIYFDCRHYMSQRPDLTKYQDPLSHYLAIGWKEGKNPSPYFDTKYYLSQVPALYKTNINPLVHYLESGSNLKINPHPLIDISYYVSRHPIIYFYGWEPLAHFISRGAREGRISHPFLNSEYYKLIHGRKIKSIFSHYVKSKEESRIPITPYFDTKYYLSQNPNIQRGQDPFFHYLITGWREGKNPSPYFDNSFYLQQKPRHFYFNESPLNHFYRQGRFQNIKPSFSNITTEGAPQIVIPKVKRKEKILLFMHIPKTAGTSFKAYVRKLFKNRCYTLEIDNTPLWHEVAYQAALSKYSENIEVLFGHFHFGLHEALNGPAEYITFLRHPVERIISLYQFQRVDRFSNINRANIKNPTLKNILTQQLIVEFNNQMTHMISGIPPADRYENNREALNKALENIENHFSFVGIQEELDKSVNQLARKMGWPPRKLLNLNQSRVSVRDDVLKDKTLVKLIEDSNQLDIELYEKMRSKLLHGL